MIQLLPGADDEFIEKLEAKMALIYSVSSYFDRGLTNAEIIKELLGDIPFDLFDEAEIEYHCDCSRERTKKALYSLSRADIAEIVEDGKDIEMTCRFCDKVYNFTIDELKEIAKEQ